MTFFTGIVFQIKVFLQFWLVGEQQHESWKWRFVPRFNSCSSCNGIFFPEDALCEVPNSMFHYDSRSLSRIFFLFLQCHSWTPTGISERVGSTGTKLGFSLPWTRLQINCKQDVMPSCSTNPLLSRSVCWRNSAILRNGASKKWKGAMMGGCQTNENWSLSRFVGRYPFQVIQFGCQTSKQLFNSEYTYEKFSFLLHSLMYNHNYNHYAITELFRCSDK